ncbi:MAG: rhomboid family intramembrane serine protease [Cyanobacteriota bacterium]|nr:rhomboid family intramembrane serine protease [Cyanobacteriota bacterium]
MNTGRRLGLQLRNWLESGELRESGGMALANRWADSLGGDDSLKPPLRDLASRPLFLQALRVSGTSRQASLETLSQELSRIYSPAVMAELLDLFEEFSGEPLQRAPAVRSVAPVFTAPSRSRLPTVEQLRQLAPGVALSAGAALVGMWLGQELERLLFRSWGWNGSVVLILWLTLLELAGASPVGPWLRKARLGSADAGCEGESWRWLLAPWLHVSVAEAVLCLLLLLVVLGPSPLALGSVILRYLLTSLAAMVPALLIARRSGLERVWGGSAGVVGALIGLGASLSLLQGRALVYRLGGDALPLEVPAWVLLVVFASAQIIRTTASWDRSAERQQAVSRRERLLSEPWLWGLMLGSGWGVISWLMQQLERLSAAGLPVFVLGRPG